jgi:hypothetical protein
MSYSRANLYQYGVKKISGQANIKHVSSFGRSLKLDLLNEKSGIPELNLDYAALVALTREKSNFLEDIRNSETLIMDCAS